MSSTRQEFVMWFLVTLTLVISCAYAQDFDPETRQRLVDIFGRPTSELDDDDSTGNGTSSGNDTACECLPYIRCRVSNESFYGGEEVENRHKSCENPFDWCCEPHLVRPDRQPARTGCGWSLVSGSIDNGTARQGEFPWVVAVLKIEAALTWTPSEYVASGSIIHQSVVLTAAHKVDKLDPNTLKCRAGEWNSSSTSERLSHQDRLVSKITKHEGYSRRLVQNSIALLFLEKPFDLAHYSHMGTACLGLELPPPGTICYGTGWGKRSHGPTGQYSEVLKKVSLPLVAANVCEKQLRSTHMGDKFKLHASQICAGGGKTDTCTGDGGAPLVCRIGSSGLRYAIFGMVAWGVGCGEERPAVYVNVPPFRGWVADVMSARQYDAASYQYTTDTPTNTYTTENSPQKNKDLHNLLDEVFNRYNNSTA